MPPRFEATLLEAVDFLHAVPRSRQDKARAKSLFEAFRSSHPEVHARLVAGYRPGWPTGEFDILLAHPDKGTVAVTFCPDGGAPWSIEYADHWASNFLVTIRTGGTEQNVTVQDALLALKLESDQRPGLMEQIVEQKLIAMFMEKDPPSVSQDELQEAADAFRAANGLLTAESTRKQLGEWGVSEDYFQQMILEAVQRRKLRERITDGKIESFFAAHRTLFDRARCWRVAAPDRPFLERLLLRAREAGLASAVGGMADDADADRVELGLARSFVRDLPPPLATAALGTVVGPFEHEGKWCLGQVVEKDRAQLDDETRDSIRRLLFRTWLEQQRGNAQVEWHWL